MFSEYGIMIRQFLKDLFGSGLTARLEIDLLNLREDMDRRLQDKDEVIAGLREEKALLNSKLAMYEMVIMPRTSREGAEVVAFQKPAKPNFAANAVFPPTKSRWEQVQDEWDAQGEKEEQDEQAKKAAAKG